MISIREVTKIYEYRASRQSIASFLFPRRERLTALESVNFQVKKGKTFGLLGPNGAGKTTLIKLIAGLLKPTAGGIKVNGKDIFQSQKEVGLVLGDTLLYNVMTGRDNLEYTARLYGICDVDRRIKKLVELLEMEEQSLDRYVSEYSLGMRVKLCLARALVYDPPVLLLDEPTLGLDPRFALHVRDKIKQLGKTIILTTHYMEEAEFLSDSVGILHRGRLVAQGSPADLKNQVQKEENATLTDVFLELTAIS
ncbi:MAG: ABC transporter ATP-binding protein [Candidatus Omnitrophica bacterium]|nr:ABC transporter ATP-binding protein [Candidatus Omnitrophota bacterium]